MFTAEMTDAWDTLLSLGISEQTLRVVTSINGSTMEALQDILFAEFGYRNFAQLD